MRGPREDDGCVHNNICVYERAVAAIHIIRRWIRFSFFPRIPPFPPHAFPPGSLSGRGMDQDEGGGVAASHEQARSEFEMEMGDLESRESRVERREMGRTRDGVNRTA